MNVKTLLVFIVIIGVIIVTTLFFRDDTKKPDSAGDSSGLIVSQNAIYAAEQAPGENITVSVVHFETPGFVVIHEDTSGVPGGVLGASGLLPSGETKNTPPIALSRTTKDSETLYAMLHLDDGDGVFDAAKDNPARDSVSAEPVMMIIEISQDAAEPGAVNL
ncbi:MAG: hypothetical protein Q7R86_01445 [bacterium]|nr:hypothetical protein [bacterium]